MVQEDVEAYGTVAENSHSLYVPLVIGLENVYLNGEKADNIDLIIYDGAVRGEFKKGLRLHIKGRLVNIIKGGEKKLCLDVVDGFNIELERFKAGAPYLKSRMPAS